ncbi:hypothetical protein [Ruegeria atlantica]|nr:hypothetical protein [Ruegeria atlantica]
MAVILKDTLNDLGLAFIDPPFPCGDRPVCAHVSHDIVAVGDPTG